MTYRSSPWYVSTYITEQKYFIKYQTNARVSLTEGESQV